MSYDLRKKFLWERSKTTIKSEVLNEEKCVGLKMELLESGEEDGSDWIELVIHQTGSKIRHLTRLRAAGKSRQSTRSAAA